MNNAKKNIRSAQALLEVMLLFTLFMFMLSMIVNMGFSFSENQKFMMSTFRHALKQASTKDVKENSLSFSAEYLKQIRVPDVSSPYKVSTVQEIRSGAGIYRTPYLQYAQSLDEATAPRRNIVIASDGAGGKDTFTDIDASKATNLSRKFTGFVTAGYRKIAGLPARMDLDGDSKPESVCVIQQMSDPDDMYPRDGILWSWVAICMKNYKAGDDLRTAPLFMNKSCQQCDSESWISDDYSVWTHYVADGHNDEAVCHPAATADSLSGVKDFVDNAAITADVTYYFQAGYDPSVALTKDTIKDGCDKGYCGAVLIDEKTNTDFKNMWVKFAGGGPNDNSYFLLPSNMTNRPFLSRGMSIWLPFSQMEAAGYVMTDDEKMRLWKDEPILYGNCAQSSPGVETPCGATFTILAITGNCNGTEQKMFSLNDGSTEFYFNPVTGLVLSHAAWGDIDGKAVTEGIPEQGIKESRVRTDITKMQSSTQMNDGVVTATKTVDVTDTITRSIKTSPYGEMNGTTVDAVQERTVKGTNSETFNNE